MWTHPPPLRKPGLFITATDTGVGKTVVTCAIAHVLRQHWGAVGVCKPFATGCPSRREGLISEDAQALSHFSGNRLPLDVINPVRFAAPLAPAVAAEEARQSIDWDAIARSLQGLDDSSDVLLIEGIGGVLVPLEGTYTVLDFAGAIGYPVLVVARGGLGTLNHTAMTVRLLRQAKLRVAGVVMNGYDARGDDASAAGNRAWIERLCDCPVLAVLPRCAEQTVRPHDGEIDGAILDAAAAVDWRSRADRPIVT